MRCLRERKLFTGGRDKSKSWVIIFLNPSFASYTMKTPRCIKRKWTSHDSKSSHRAWIILLYNIILKKTVLKCIWASKPERLGSITHPTHSLCNLGLCQSLSFLLCKNQDRILLWTECLCLTPNSYVETLSPNLVVWWGGAFRRQLTLDEVTRMGPHHRISVLIRRRRD